MRMLLNLVGLLLALGVVMWLARDASHMRLSPSATEGAPIMKSPQQVQQHYKGALESVMQQARPPADEP